MLLAQIVFNDQHCEAERDQRTGQCKQKFASDWCWPCLGHGRFPDLCYPTGGDVTGTAGMGKHAGIIADGMPRSSTTSVNPLEEYGYLLIDVSFSVSGLSHINHHR